MNVIDMGSYLALLILSVSIGLFIAGLLNMRRQDVIEAAALKLETEQFAQFLVDMERAPTAEERAHLDDTAWPQMARYIESVSAQDEN